MSRETIEWLNNNVLMGHVDDREKWAGTGFVSDRGDGNNTDMKPWFAQEDYTGGYAGSVPVEAVMERLFHWDALEGPLHTEIPCEVSEADNIGADGTPTKRLILPDHKAILRSDNGHVMGIFKQGYTVHQYDKWLIENVAAILDDDVQIDSAGLLMGGGVAWVSISMPETVQTSVDFAIRPRILAFTSHNGKHSTTYQRSVNAPVCDNSLDVEVNDHDDKRIKIKHSSKSLGAIGSARDALGILYSDTEQMVGFFEQLAQWEVSGKEYAQILDKLEPVPEDKVVDGKVTNKRAQTAADVRRLEITKMYAKDHRAAPWQGTALGVLQAFNTWEQQTKNVVGQRVERQMMGTLDGAVTKYDAMVLNAIGDVTGRVTDLVPVPA